jgi:Na+-driven multidrug efflux pump
MAVFFALLLYPLSLILPFLFKVDDGILYQAQLMLYVMMVFYPFNAFNMCMIVGVCRSGGDTVYAAFADLFWMWAVAIPLGALTAFVWHGLPWLIFLALQSEQLVKAVTVFIRLRSGRWLHHVSV